MKVKMKTIEELKEFARFLGGDMSEVIHYFIDQNNGKLLKGTDSPSCAFVAKGIHVLEHEKEFLVVDHPNPISKEEFERTKALYNA